MTTVRSLIEDALIELGVQDPSESMGADRAAHGLRVLNRMISAWDTEDLMVYTVDRPVFNLVAGKQAYTIGVGGDFVTTMPIRPAQIDMASILVTAGSNELPIEILNDEQWRDVVVKNTSGSYPLQMWSNGNYPLNTLSFWPIPSAAYQVVLYIWGQTSEFPDVNQAVTLPQGYEEAIVPNLSARLAPSYGLQASPSTTELARAAKARIKKMNWEPTYRSVDSALAGVSSNVGQRSRGYVVD